MRTKNKKVNMFFKIVVLVFVFYSIFSLAQLNIAMSNNRKEKSALQTQINDLQQNVDELNYLLQEGTKEDLIERAARQKLGYVYTDEQVYTDLSGN